MRMMRGALLTMGLCATACATAPAPKVLPPPVQQSHSPLRGELEDVYAKIVARENTPVAAPRVDVEAAASMDIPDHKSIRGALALFTTELKPSVQESLIRSAK